MPRKPYFAPDPSGPEPLQHTIERRVRFDEVDMMGVAWHGRYVSYFEEARVALGKKYGVSYSDFINRRTPAPIRQLHVDYHRPLEFDEPIRIQAMLHYSEAARMNFEFIIRDGDHRKVCTGYSVQLMTGRDGELLLAPPPFFRKFVDRWRDGEFA